MTPESPPAGVSTPASASSAPVSGNGPGPFLELEPCDGIRSPFRPHRRHPMCVQCELAILTREHQAPMPPPAVHDGERWRCDRRVGEAIAHALTRSR